MHQEIHNIAEICARKGVKNVILSPGSRCAPLTVAFVRHPDIHVKTISDERSAAFIGMGMAQQLKEPVGLVCTSGSAVYNYAPAVAEAFFQEIPLLIFTADRPPEWIDQLDGQTIRQQDVYHKHVKKSYQVPVSFHHPDEKWHLERIISEAINLSRSFPPGPVHINIPLREPLYPAKNQGVEFSETVKIIEECTAKPKLNSAVKEQFINSFKKFNKILIVAGQGDFDQQLNEELEKIIEKFKIPVVSDIIANLHTLKNNIRYHDIFLKLNNPEISELKPDLLITFGKSVISKNLKFFLRKFKPSQHWHLQEAGTTADTFQSLTHILRESPCEFFNDLNAPDAHIEGTKNEYFDLWKHQNAKAGLYLKNFFSKAEFGDFLSMNEIFNSLSSCNLHISNSMSVRYANFIGIDSKEKDIKVNVNRGTSGIDGSNSTAVGASMASGKSTVLITGDMAFFYDRNAFWHNYNLPDLKIIIINNHSGGIFGLIDGPANLPELEEFFETKQQLDASPLAQEFNFEYFSCYDQKNLQSILNSFFVDSKKTKILEIFTDQSQNRKIFQDFKKHFN